MEKTRNQSVAEYFEAIQREYIIAEFRKKVYYNVKDKQYYNKVMSYKAEKINNIANRNNLNSVLNDVVTYNKFRDELFDANGHPKFMLNETDLENYYLSGSEFAYKGCVYILKGVKEKIAQIELHDNDLLEVNISEISRLL